MIDAYEVYVEYLAVSRHFKSKSYNYNKYKGRVNTSRATFIKKRDRGLYYKLGVRLKSREAVRNFFIANFTKKEEFTSYNMLEESSFSCYNRWVRINKNLSQHFLSDVVTLTNLNKSVKELFISEDGTLPLTIQMFICGDINIETLVIFDVYFNFVERNSDLSDDKLFQKYAQKIRKYKSFIILDHYVIKQIIDNKIAK